MEQENRNSKAKSVKLINALINAIELTFETFENGARKTRYEYWLGNNILIGVTEKIHPISNEKH